MPSNLFDTHAHLDDQQLAPTIDAVIDRAVGAGVETIITVGTTAASSRACVALAQQHAPVFAAVGIQPNYVHEATAEDWDCIRRLTNGDRVVAIGETGLDAYWDFAPFELQQTMFRKHIVLARQTDLPFIVHMRDCGDAVVSLMRELATDGPLAGVMHSFTGDMRLAEACLELGLYISFAGMVTFKKSDALRDVAKHIPAERLLLETDAPYLSPHPRRGQRPNEPALLIHTARCLADVRGVGVDALAAQTATNARRLFRDCGKQVARQ